MAAGLEHGVWKDTYGTFLCFGRYEQFWAVTFALCCLEVLHFLVILKDSSTFASGEDAVTVLIFTLLLAFRHQLLGGTPQLLQCSVNMSLILHVREPPSPKWSRLTFEKPF